MTRPHLTELAYQTLMALDEGHDYAHGIALAIGASPRGMHHILARLVDEGLIQSVGTYRGEETRTRLRRRYVPTAKGARVIRTERAADAAWESEAAA